MLKLLFILLSHLFFDYSYANPTQQIDELLKPWDNLNNPGMAVAVNRNGQTTYEAYYGLADLEHKIPISKDTKFLIASVSKQFSAFAIALLADDGLLEFDDDIRKYIPELPAYENPITVMHLMNHTSGIRDADDLNSLVGAGLSDYTSFDDIYQLILHQQALNFTPGEQYDYSNSGYILMAKIVENISGQSFREFMDARVFKPLGMHNTLVFDNPFEVIGNKATAYFSNDGQSHSKNNLFSSAYGSTGMYTTLNDLNKWSQNFTKHKVGNPEIFKQMATQGTLNNGETISYALGQEIKSHRGQKAIFHGGGQGAYRAYLLRFPEQDLSVTLLSNSSYSTSFIVDYAYRIADLYLEADTTQVETKEKFDRASFKSVDVNPEVLEKYVGQYQIQPGLIFSLKLKQGNLELFITGSDQSIPLAAASNNKFYLMDSDNGYHMVFPNENNQPSLSLSYYQFDMEYKGERVNLVDFDHAKIDWHELTGLYYSKELNTVYSLSFDGKNLIAKHARNLPIKLTPHQPDIFYGDATFFQEVEFIKDNKGRVIKMLVSGSRSKNIVFTPLAAK